MAERQSQVSAVQGVEVEVVHPRFAQDAALLGGNDYRYVVAVGGIAVQPREELLQPARHTCSAHGAEFLHLLEVRYRQQPGQDGNSYATLARFAHIIEIEIDIEEILVRTGRERRT